MGIQTATLEVAQEIAEAIKANATARQLPLDDYLRSLLASEDGAAEAPAETQPEPNWGMLEVMRRIAERNQDKPLTSGADTLKILREARAGAMFGYEPTE
jgi:hypothetical protein